MECSEFRTLFEKYLNEGLSGEEKYALLEHIGDCDECDAKYGEDVMLSLGFESMETPPLPEGFHERVCAAVNSCAPKKKSKAPRFIAAAACIAAGVAVVSLCVSSGVLKSKGSSAGFAALDNFAAESAEAEVYTEEFQNEEAALPDMPEAAMAEEAPAAAADSALTEEKAQSKAHIAAEAQSSAPAKTTQEEAASGLQSAEMAAGSADIYVGSAETLDALGAALDSAGITYSRQASVISFLCGDGAAVNEILAGCGISGEVRSGDSVNVYLEAE